MQSLPTKIFWVFGLPLSCAWALFMRARRSYYVSSRQYRATLKIICVGNLHSGGSGKTPLVEAISKRFQLRSPVILSRGYLGTLSSEGAEIDRLMPNGSLLYGDEPWMLSQQQAGPVFISKKRVAGVKRIEKQYPNSLVILDDGFQHLALGRDVDIICINTDKEVAASFCLPLGGLRESFKALDHADAVVLTPGSQNKNLEVWQNVIQNEFPKLPCFVAHSKVDGFFEGPSDFEFDSLQNWVSFSGIASPERFVKTLSEYSPSVEHIQSYPDHHRYVESDIEWLINEKNRAGAFGFVTTDKDWYKVYELFKPKSEKVISLRVGYDLPDSFWIWLEAKVKG